MSYELFILVPAVVTLIGLVIIGVTVRHLILARGFARTAVATTGTVIHVRTQAGYSGPDMESSGPLYFPTVRFTTARGQSVEFTPRFGTSLSPHAVGQQVPVLYQPNDPNSARINTVALRRVAPGCVLTVGIVLALVGGVITTVFAFAISFLHSTHFPG